MATSQEYSGRPSRITIPVRCHPLTRFAFAEMARQHKTYDQMEWEAGVLRQTFKAWRTRTRPGLDTMEAVLGALGWALLPVPRAETLPPALRRDLEGVAEKYAVEFPGLEFIAAAVGRVPHTRTPYNYGQRLATERKAA